MARALREDIAELENALGGLDADLLNSNVIDVETGSDPENDDDGGAGGGVAVAAASAGGDEGSLKLRNWQMKKLARALKTGRRKTSNAMISSIVHVTNIPRKKVVKWFEDKRAEEGVPDRRLPYERSVPDAA